MPWSSLTQSKAPRDHGNYHGEAELVWRMQQTLIKVHDRVGWIAEMAVTEKLKKMWQSMT
jgi:hypothetical protein